MGKNKAKRESPKREFCLKWRNNVPEDFSGPIEILCNFWRGLEGL